MTASSPARDAIDAVYSSTGTQPAIASARRPLMGGTATITLVGGTEALLEAAFALAHRCEQRWSRFLPSSDVSRLNWAQGRTVEVDPLTVRLIAAMQHGAAITDGDYNPTVLPSVIESGYAASAVDPDRVTALPPSARTRAGLGEVVVSDRAVTLREGTALDPGGIGKGLAADVVTEFAIGEGALGAMVEIGGDVVVVGRAPDNVAWRIGVEDPFDAHHHVDGVRLSRGSIVTSSQRKRRFPTPSGERHHLIDHRTGAPATTAVQTATVIAATGATAEALTKPAFLRRPDDYLSWLPTVGAAGLLIDADGALHPSPNWKHYA